MYSYVSIFFYDAIPGIYHGLYRDDDQLIHVDTMTAGFPEEFQLG